MEKTPQIVYNAIRTPDGTLLESRHRHDYNTHTDKNGAEYMVDGGTDYLRRNCGYSDEKKPEELSLYAHDPHEDIRERVTWGTYGKSGKEELHYIAVKDMTDEHIIAILDDTQCQIPDWMERIFKDELVHRDYEKNNFIDPTQMTRQQVEFLLKNKCACASIFCDYEFDEREKWGYSSTQGFYEFYSYFDKDDKHREYRAKYIVAMSWLLRAQHDMTWNASHKIAEAYVLMMAVEEYDDDDYPLNPASIEEVEQIRGLGRGITQ